MIGLDTNVLLRYLVQDDLQQAKLVSDLIEKEKAIGNLFFINEITLCEIIWVLKAAYHYDKNIILDLVEQILFNNDISVASHREAKLAFHDYQEGNADFSDYLIGQLNKKAGCEVTISFDKKACLHQNFKSISP